VSAGGGRGLDPAVRAALAGELLAALPAACPGSTAQLTGSLGAAGGADAYSDIDVVWRVPAADFARCVEGARRTLGRVGPLLSLRADADHADAPGRRVLFAAFRGLPLFWRLDLDVHADPPEAAGVPAAASTDPWSPAASALADAVAAIKAVLRSRPGTARALLERASLQVGAPPAPTGDWRLDVARLTAAVTAADPSHRRLATAVDALAAEHLPC
jgi:hypothetical protein